MWSGFFIPHRLRIKWIKSPGLCSSVSLNQSKRKQTLDNIGRGGWEGVGGRLFITPHSQPFVSPPTYKWKFPTIFNVVDFCLCWDVTSNSQFYFLQQHIAQFIFQLYLCICKLLSVPPPSAHSPFVSKWKPFYFHLLHSRTTYTLLLPAQSSCLSDLCLSRAATRQIWHKNKVNWSVLVFKRSHQLFSCRGRPAPKVHQETHTLSWNTAAAAAALFSFYVSLLCICFSLRQGGNVIRRNVRKMSCLSLNPKQTAFFFLLVSLFLLWSSHMIGGSKPRQMPPHTCASTLQREND